MPDRQKGYLIIECDACGDVYEGDADDFQTFIAQAKREGWKKDAAGGQGAHLPGLLPRP